MLEKYKPVRNRKNPIHHSEMVKAAKWTWQVIGGDVAQSVTGNSESSVKRSAVLDSVGDFFGEGSPNRKELRAEWWKLTPKQRTDILNEAFPPGRLYNPARSKYKARSLYEGFHGTPSKGLRSVTYENPKGPLIKIGRLASIEYNPEQPSKHTGTRFVHESGDTGNKVLRSNLILATDRTGKNFYLIKDKKSKHPYFSERGIIG